ncbi:MAG: hypothetical protein IKW89_08955 [Bacteroidales bacterium]|nr:hypothetical protein [Bacteroidales bacterium]
MILQTNVKLNFGLNVIRKRPDGYHDIETLFVPCHEFGDTLEVITGDDYSRTSASLFGRYGGLVDPEGQPALGDTQPQRSEDGLRRGRTVPPDLGRELAQGISEDGKLMITIAREEGVDWDPLKDLCAKAYYLLDNDFHLPPVKIFLEKKAPVGAGLGGGSADAAFTLKALNDLCALGLSNEKLSEYASKLGSDCAFFVWNRPMIGTGRGDILEPFDLDLSGHVVKVLVPEGISVSTGEAYRGIVPRFNQLNDAVSKGQGCQNRLASLDPTARSAPLRSGPPSYRAEGGRGFDTLPLGDPCLISVLRLPIEDWKGRLVNDFETTVFKAHPELEAIKQSLYDSGAVYAAMSGSGSAIFGIYKK